ncbi:ribonuclease II [Pseudonocardia dioxanivorans CB1190]|uniref:Ribonuclease II n=1 Tax=Pseudonocardia dioxanivorans (strain ATCC 55486 / DSM 44775 / JCM 13855 / CB1190) TaxID=675635 RepID=F4CPV6_PSEUX|nr:RNB domain-containing ribonuclease [Pseudonocardia dioxanivorans]AEA26139.1 ribonuclease II [Pseudonocardia dioxanivorans CB1190]
MPDDGPSRPATVPDFDAVRAEFALPAEFPADVLAEAARAAAVAATARTGGRRDATDVDLVTIDPPGSKDLDQAVGIRARRGGYRVHYAIADLAAVVVPGGPLDVEVRRRGQTMYLPDGSVPLHPPVLSEGAASLLPDGPRPAVLWTIDLDDAGETVDISVERALVRSRGRLDYGGVQADLDAGRPLPDAIALLPAVGRLRRELAVARGAVELELPEQEVVPDGAGGWTVRARQRVDLDGWNAEISLLTGTSAATLMLGAGVGVLRTLPAPDPDAVARLRALAAALGVGWPADVTPARFLAGLPLDTPRALALCRAATSLLRGAGYAVFDGPAAPPPVDPGHGGIGAPYAHVTAPLRRLVDRFGTEICLAVAAGEDPADWVREALPTLPSLMAASDTVAGKVDRACVDRTEAVLFADRIGQEVEVIVLRDEPGEVYLPQPPVLARCRGPLSAGDRVLARVAVADPATGTVEFAVG